MDHLILNNGGDSAALAEVALKALREAQRSKTSSSGSVFVSDGQTDEDGVALGTGTIINGVNGGVQPWVGDTTAPGKPLGISAESHNGAVWVSWDGTLEGGIPADFDHVQFTAVDGSKTVDMGQLKAAGKVTAAELTAGDTVTITAVAYDDAHSADGSTAPNASVASDPVTVVVQSAVDASAVKKAQDDAQSALDKAGQATDTADAAKQASEGAQADSKNAVTTANSANDTSTHASSTAQAALSAAQSAQQDTVTQWVPQYAVNQSTTDAPTTGWSVDKPSWTAGHYIWLRTVVGYGSGDYMYSNPVLLTGNPGADGEMGPRGPKGDTGETGPVGDTGETGPKGDKGDAGLASYTHIAYADNAGGSGFNQNPNGKKYIGIYVDQTAADSSVASRYTWSLFVGNDGQTGATGAPGAKGADGRTPYFHTAYATSSDGSTGFSTTNPNGATYLGSYTDYTSADSTKPSDYVWVKTLGPQGQQGKQGATGATGAKGDTGSRGPAGADGKDGTSVTIKGTVTSAAALPGSASVGDGYITADDGHLHVWGDNGFTDVGAIRGPNGASAYVHTAWANSADGTSNFSLTDGGTRSYMGVYSDNIQADSTKPSDYVWTRIQGPQGAKGDTGATGPTGSQGSAGPKGDTGDKGATGAPGATGAKGSDGADGVSSYTHIAYADNAGGSGFNQNPNGKKYIGIYVDTVKQDSSDPTKYTWSLYVGADGQTGATGAPGKAGADGRTPYFHTAYAKSADGKIGFNVSDPSGALYLGTYTDYTQADSSNPTSYVWVKTAGQQGSKGDTGDDGVSVTAITPYWALGTSAPAQPAVSAPPSPWQSTEPGYSRNQHLYKTSKVTYDNGQFAYMPVVMDSSYEYSAAAESSARDAVQTATNANTTAQTAQSTAGSAQIAAKDASGVATQANATAVSANQSATSAQTAANLALANAQELVVNGGFETGDLTGWTASNATGIGVTAVANETHSGKYMLSGNLPTSPNAIEFLSKSFPVVQGRILRCSGWFWNDGVATAANICIKFNDGSLSDKTDIASLGDGWKYASVDVTVPSGVSSGRFRLGYYHPDSSTVFTRSDDLSVKDITEAQAAQKAAEDAQATADTANTAAKNAASIANAAQAAAQGAQTTADGKNKIFSSASEPAHTGLVPGDLWFQLDSSSYVTGIQTWNGSSFVDYLVVANEILVAGSVGTTQIKNGAITTDLLTSNAVTALKIAAKTITGDKLDVGSVAAAIITSGLFKTADSGARVTIDSTGIKAYDAKGNVTFQVDSATGKATMVGGMATALSGKRISIAQSSDTGKVALLNDGSELSSLTFIDDTNSSGYVYTGLYTGQNAQFVQFATLVDSVNHQPDPKVYDAAMTARGKMLLDASNAINVNGTWFARDQASLPTAPQVVGGQGMKAFAGGIEYTFDGSGAWVSQTRTRVYTGSKIINGTGASEYTFLSEPEYTAIVGRAVAYGDVIVFTNGDRAAGTFTSAFSAIDNKNNSVNIVFPSNVSGARRINYAIIVTS